MDSLRQLMTSLLMSSAARRVNFYLDHIHVDGSGLSFVALALQSPPAGQRGFSIRVSTVGSNFEAAYDPSDNTFNFPRANYGTVDHGNTDVAFQKMSIIHECIHALIDSTSAGRKTWALSDEAAAYVGAALYHIYDTQSDDILTPTAPPWTGAGNDIFNKAHVIAVKLWKTNGYACDPTEAKDLRDLIARDSAYAHFRWNRKESYLNNGVGL
jgi:hypothetical protein